MSVFRPVCVCLAVLFFTVHAGARQKPPLDRVDAYLVERMAAHHIPGLAVAVVKDGKIAKLKGYGLASLEFEEPVSESTPFQIYSVTKAFAGLAVMKLVEDGALTLDTRARSIVSEAPPSWDLITIRQLLDHTSGLPELNDNPEYAQLTEDKKRLVTPDEAIRYAISAPLRSLPGAKYAYHRFSYTLFGAIVQRVTKMPFDVFLRDRIFNPLGMASTRFGDWESVIPRRATAYNYADGTLRNWFYGFGFGNPGAGLNSSASDLAKLMTALQNRTLLSDESLAAMWTPARLEDGSRPDYALGWSVGQHRGRQVVGHEGGGAAWIAHFPADRLSVIVLCNLNGARADELQYGVADLY